MKATSIWLDRIAFSLPFYLALCTSEALYLAQVRKLKIAPEHIGRWINEGGSATTHYFPGSAMPGGKNVVIVTIKPSGEDGIVISGLLVHEATHVFQRACACVGEDSPSSEFEAYSIQWISQCLMWAYRDQVIRK